MEERSFKYDEGNFAACILGCIVLVGITIWLSIKLISNENWPFSYLFYLGILLGLFIFLLRRALRFRNLSFERERILVQNIRNKIVEEIKYANIERLVEHVVEEESNKKYSLLIYYSGKKIKLNKSLYPQYDIIKEELINRTGKTVRVESGDDKEFGNVLIVFGSVSISLSIMLFLFTKEVKLEDTVEILITHNSKPEILETGGKSNTHYIQFTTREYPEYIFEIRGNAYNVFRDTPYLKNVIIGDTLRMYLLKEEYEGKLIHTKEPGFWISHKENTEIIDVLALRKGNLNFSTIQEYLSEHGNYNDREVKGTCIIGAIAIVIGSFFRRKKSAFK